MCPLVKYYQIFVYLFAALLLCSSVQAINANSFNILSQLPLSAESMALNNFASHGLTLEPHHYVNQENLSNYVDTLSSVPDYIFDNAALIASMDSEDFHRDLYGTGRAPRSSANALASSLNLLSNDLIAPAKLSYDLSSRPFKPVSRPSKHSNKHRSNSQPFANLVHIITNVVPPANRQYSNQPKPSSNHHQVDYKSSNSNNEVDVDLIRNILTQVLKHLEENPQNGKYGSNQKRQNTYPAHTHHHATHEDGGTSSINNIQYRPLMIRPPASRPKYQQPLVNSLPPSPAVQAKLRNNSPYPMQNMGFVGEDGLIAIPLPPNVVKFNFFGKNKGAKRKPCKEDEYKRKADY